MCVCGLMRFGNGDDVQHKSLHLSIRNTAECSILGKVSGSFRGNGAIFAKTFFFYFIFLFEELLLII